MLKRFLRIAAASIFVAAFSFPAFAEGGRIGLAHDKEITFQPPATPIMEQIEGLHTEVMYIVTAIVILVLALLIYCMVRFNSKANPKPSKTTHNTTLEIVWTIIPIIILAVIGVKSLRLLYAEDVIPKADMVIKVTGHQWYWTYEYPDKGISFDSNIVPPSYYDGTMDEATKKDWDQRLDDLRVMLGRTTPIKPRLLMDADTRLVVPVNTTIKVMVTADDVIHSWTVPAFGFKMDAIPGRMNHTWFRAEQIGTFYGQCSELCGIKHAFMPIVVEVVSKEDYQKWLTRAETFYGAVADPNAPRVADAAHK